MKVYTEKQVKELLEMQRGNCYVAVLNETKNVKRIKTLNYLFSFSFGQMSPLPKAAFPSLPKQRRFSSVIWVGFYS